MSEGGGRAQAPPYRLLKVSVWAGRCRSARGLWIVEHLQRVMHPACKRLVDTGRGFVDRQSTLAAFRSPRTRPDAGAAGRAMNAAHAAASTQLMRASDFGSISHSSGSLVLSSACILPPSHMAH